MYFAHLAVLVLLYSIQAMALNLTCGYAGMVPLCQSALAGIGAYCATLIYLSAGLPFGVAILIAVNLSVVLSAVVIWPSLSMRGDPFVLSTLALQTIFTSIAMNWTTVTNGLNGISGIRPMTLAGYPLDTPLLFLPVATTAFAITWLGYSAIVGSPFGRLLRALRDDEVALLSLGKDTKVIKVSVFAASAGISAFAGSLFAVYSQYIEPLSFGMTESIFILSCVMLGGAGSQLGPCIGVIVMVLVPEILRVLPFAGSQAPVFRQLLVGLIIVLLMRIRPQGLMGTYRFE